MRSPRTQLTPRTLRPLFSAAEFFSFQNPSPSNLRYGSDFEWEFTSHEQAWIISGSATLTSSDPDTWGGPVTIQAGDLVIFPKGWVGSWSVPNNLKKYFAFFDDHGVRTF